jgi:hypothetical protein
MPIAILLRRLSSPALARRFLITTIATQERGRQQLVITTSSAQWQRPQPLPSRLLRGVRSVTYLGGYAPLSSDRHADIEALLASIG